MGALGYVGRASGVNTDARRDHPFVDAYEGLTVATLTDGDALARYRIRALEVRESADLVTELLPMIEPGCHRSPVDLRHGPGHGVGIVEGPRGTIVNRLELDTCGTIAGITMVDPSSSNWPALRIALTGTSDSDFGLANASLNISIATSSETKAAEQWTSASFVSTNREESYLAAWPV